MGVLEQLRLGRTWVSDEKDIHFSTELTSAAFGEVFANAAE
jgi:hypothetical protein